MIALDDRLTTDRADMAATATRFRSLGLPQAPILQWAAIGALKVTFLRTAGAQLPRHVGTSQIPEIVIIGDDPPIGAGLSQGPDGWRCVKRLRRFRPATALIHASGGKTQHYSMAAFATMSGVMR